MPPVKEVLDALETMRKVHISKNEDYAELENPFSNFDFSGDFASHFKLDVDKPFAILIGVKFARLYNLLNKNGSANNESVEDTFIDIANYVLLWRADRIRKRKERPTEHSVRLDEAKAELARGMQNAYGRS